MRNVTLKTGVMGLALLCMPAFGCQAPAARGRGGVDEVDRGVHAQPESPPDGVAADLRVIYLTPEEAYGDGDAGAIWEALDAAAAFPAVERRILTLARERFEAGRPMIHARKQWPAGMISLIVRDAAGFDAYFGAAFRPGREVEEVWVFPVYP